MIDGKMLSQLEQANKIPAGSLHMLEMGDGSGTKVVTQETLVEETGNALKIGDLKKLETENKESLVDAINEAKKSGGNGGTVDILDTPEEVEANTEAEKVAGALAVKEMFSALNDKLTLPDGTPIYFDMKDGIFGYNTDPERGADTFHPFSSQRTFTVNLTAGYIQASTYTHSSSVKFQNAKIKVNVRSFSGKGSLSVNADSKTTTINSTGNYTFEGKSITITANKDSSGHTDSTSATLDIEIT